MRPLDAEELQALTLFASGKTADEMAVALGVSKSMALHYLRVAARKLGARNRVHAVAIADTHGFDQTDGRRRLMTQRRGGRCDQGVAEERFGFLGSGGVGLVETIGSSGGRGQ